MSEFNVIDLTKSLFASQTTPDNKMTGVARYEDKMVPKKRREIIQEKVFDFCNEDDTDLFQINEELKEELKTALEEDNETEISQLQLYTNESTNSSLVYIKTDDCYCMLELLLVICPEHWCAVVLNCSHPVVETNLFQYEGSRELDRDFDVDAERSTFDALLLAAERHFEEFCAYNHDDDAVPGVGEAAEDDSDDE